MSSTGSSGSSCSRWACWKASSATHCPTTCCPAPACGSSKACLLGIPIVGTYLSFFLFGGQFPGNDLIPRLYILHVLLIPALILALVTAHLFLMFHQKHTQMPGKGRTDRNVVGQPLYPYFMAKTGAFFFFVFGVLALLGCLAQINPIWLYGPYNPVAMSSGSQPDFYMGMLEGALRIFPNWAWNLWGHTISWNVLIPALVPLGFLFTAAALWPFLERWITGDTREHHVNDRPRNAATRTAIGIAVITWYGIMWLEGANDVIAQHLSISLYLTTEIARYAVFIGPVVAYIVTKRICLGLQRKDAAMLPARIRNRHHLPAAERGVRRTARAGVGGHEGRARGQVHRSAARWRRVRTTTAVFPPRPPGAPSASCGWP